MSNNRWDLFDTAVQAAMLVAHDIDIARDAAVAALSELGDEADEGRVRRRARDRAKDLLRRRPRAESTDMDTLESGDDPVENAARAEECTNMVRVLGRQDATVLGLVQAGYTDADLALEYGCSESTARRMRLRAEQKRDTMEVQ